MANNAGELIAKVDHEIGAAEWRGDVEVPIPLDDARYLLNIAKAAERYRKSSTHDLKETSDSLHALYRLLHGEVDIVPDLPR